MTSLRLVFSAATLALLTAWSGAALADVPPADACSTTSQVGTACNNAGPNSDQPGTCENATCQRTQINPDGGPTVVSYACILCQDSSGTGGSGGSGSAPSGGGCTMAAGHEGMLTGAMLLAGLGVVLADRRRRRL